MFSHTGLLSTCLQTSKVPSISGFLWKILHSFAVFPITAVFPHHLRRVSSCPVARGSVWSVPISQNRISMLRFITLWPRGGSDHILSFIMGRQRPFYLTFPLNLWSEEGSRRNRVLLPDKIIPGEFCHAAILDGPQKDVGNVLGFGERCLPVLIKATSPGPDCGGVASLVVRHLWRALRCFG